MRGPGKHHYEDGRQGRGFCQEAHQQIRVLFHQASDVVKNHGGKNDFIKVYTSVIGVLSISGPEIRETPLLTTWKSDAP